MIEPMMIRSTIKRLLDKSEDDCMPPSIVYWQCDRGGGGSGDRKRRKRKNSLNNNKFNNNHNTNYSQRLFLLASLCYCLIIPFSEASSSMTNTSQLQQPQSQYTVQISDSYSSSSHVKPSHNNYNFNYSSFSHNMNYTSDNNNNNQNQTFSPSVYSNYNDANSNNNNNKAMRRISFLPKFANLIFPSASSYTPVSNSGSISGSPMKRRRRVRPTNNNNRPTTNKNNPNQNKNNKNSSNNNSNNNKQTKKRKKKPSKTPQKTRISPNFDSLLMNNMTKPTMHPLRVLQTEITMMNKTQSQSQGLRNLKSSAMISSTTPAAGANLIHNQYDVNVINKSNDKYDSNLENHRLVDTIPSVFVVNPIPNPYQFNGSSPITTGGKNSDMTANSVVVTNKPRIPVYIPQNKSKPSTTPFDTDSKSNDTTKTTVSETIESNINSSSPSPTEDAFLSLINTGSLESGKSEGRSALMSRFSGEESKQLHSPSYFNHINDQIAEEDNHYEVTERFPENYERNPPQQQQQNQLQTVSESQQQQQVIHNSNPHTDDNAYRHTNTVTRPKFNSYHDANNNYYAAASNSQHHYHTNDHRDEFYHHHNELSSHHGFPDHHHPSGQERHPNRPPSFKGEHHSHESQQSPDTIMDRFEVFYKEYKLLTWVAVLAVTGLALVCVLAYLYINNPPTEVVTARSMITEYLRDPGLLKFLHNLLEGEDQYGGGKRRRRKKNLTSSHPSSKAKEL